MSTGDDGTGRYNTLVCGGRITKATVITTEMKRLNSLRQPSFKRKKRREDEEEDDENDKITS